MPAQSSNPLFENSVFINCPFDAEYEPIFRAIVFTITACGFTARCARENPDSNEIRLDKIVRLIEDCRLGIHDLSRLHGATGLPRFNMPLELGIFLGCMKFGGKPHRHKKYLILESEQFRYHSMVSDLSGQDIRAHEGDFRKAIACIRDWLSNQNPPRHLPHGSILATHFEAFLHELPGLCRDLDWTEMELTFKEFTWLTYYWSSINF